MVMCSLQTVGERSGGYFELKEGSLYPALHRLERQKLLKSFWREADGRRRKYYELTQAGRAEFTARKQSWVSFAAGVNGVLGAGRLGFAGGLEPRRRLRSGKPLARPAATFSRRPLTRPAATLSPKGEGKSNSAAFRR